MVVREQESLQESILSLDLEKLDQLFSSICKRYGQLMPDTELVLLFLPKEDQEARKQILTQTTAFLLKHPPEEKK